MNLGSKACETVQEGAGIFSYEMKKHLEILSIMEEVTTTIKHEALRADAL